jgi:mannose/cellobiose epimerase-like protein (N-acyl-D-glucosamine 2-epimerase family)
MGTEKSKLAGMTLAALRDQYRHDLFEEFLPFWKRFGIDGENGGFLCSLDHDGTAVDTDKRVMFQARGLWVYSFLYNQFGIEDCLEVAQSARDFIVAHGRDDNGDWVHTLDKYGNVRKPADGLGFSGIFVAEGLQEYYRATGDQASMDLALESVHRFLKIYDDPARDVPQWYLPLSYPGMRTLGYEEVTIRVLNQILQQASYPELEARVAESVDAVLNRFWNPTYRLNNEMLTHDYHRLNDKSEDFVYLGHSIVTFWMILQEAMRIRDRALFDLTSERLRRHIEVAWDNEFGGLIRGMHVHGKHDLDKWLWTQDEALVGTMILLEHTDLQWPKQWFERIYSYVQEKFTLRQYGYPLWILGADRMVTFEPHVTRKGNYHHPRQLMLNSLALERMIEREGRVSNFWG